MQNKKYFTNKETEYEVDDKVDLNAYFKWLSLKQEIISVQV